jgi:hypothetical protein
MLEFRQDLVEKKGILTKQGQKQKTWKRRWAKLGETKISYFAKENDSYPKGSVEIDPDSIIMFVDENQIGKKYCFAIVTKNRNLYIHTDLEEDMVSWVYHLRASVYYCNLKRVLDDPRNFLKGGSAKTVEKRGMMIKQGGNIQTKKPRYFVLKDGNLNYYKTEKDLEPIDSIDLRGTKIEEKTDRVKKVFGMILHSNKGRQYFFIAANSQDQTEWIEAMQSVCKSLSEAETIQNKSHAIHNLILTRMVHGKESKGTESAPSPHSPLMWRTLSFHRSKPQYLEGASQTSSMPNSMGASSQVDITGGQGDISLLKRTATNITTAPPSIIRSPTSVLNKNQISQLKDMGSTPPPSSPITEIALEKTTSNPTSPAPLASPRNSTPSPRIQSQRFATAINLEDASTEDEDSLDIAGERDSISEIDLKKQKKLGLVNLKKKEKPITTTEEDKEAMDRMIRDPMSSHLQAKSPSAQADEEDEFEDLMLQEEEITSKEIQITPISQAFKKEDDGKYDYSSEEIEEDEMYDSDEPDDEDGMLSVTFTTTDITEKPTLKLKKNDEVTLQKRVYTRDKDTPSTFKRMNQSLEHQFRVLNVSVM